MNGVAYNQGKWVAQLQYDKEKKILGYFQTEEEAKEARLEALKELVAKHPEWTDFKKERLLKGLSLKETAELLGLSYQAASRLDDKVPPRGAWRLPYIVRFIREGVPSFENWETFTYYRNRLGVTQNEFCEKFSIPARTYQGWETGEFECPVLTKKIILSIMKEML